MEVRIGIDIGGTFTDFVLYEVASGKVETFKLLSTPANPAEAVLAGLRLAAQRGEYGLPQRIVHGSTVATNALLERKGARTALITTRGFRDVLQIGRQNRPELYDFFADPPLPLAPAELRFEVDERVSAAGQVLQSLDSRQVDELVSILRQQGVESVAVCLLFSFLHPEHELRAGAILEQAGFTVSRSSDILPEYREYERTSTTVVNAYVSPVLSRYLDRLESGLQAETGQGLAPILRVMQSNGGQISLEEARRSGVRCVLSGPAGGIVGAQRVAQLAGRETVYAGAAGDLFHPARLITFDMGGTSTDVALIDGQARLTTEAEVGGCPIRIPVLDIHTIGAGGGSLASVDLGGALRVGPESAGADPGPACYGRGELPTVTDANLVLGRLSPEHFLGGQMPLNKARAEQALAGLGKQLGVSAVEAALGVIEVVNAHMERALRLISVERGIDPGRASGAPFTLLSFGGAGGLHAVDLARRLDIPTVLVSPLASTLSAFGMLAADVVRDYTRTVMLPGDAPASALDEVLGPLVERGLKDLSAEGVSRDTIRIERLLDMRYSGQSYELNVPYHADPHTRGAAFHAAHRAAYGYERPEAGMEIVNVRVRAVGPVNPPSLQPLPLGEPDTSAALIEHRPVVTGDGALTWMPFYRFESLQPGNHFEGPAVVVRSDTTIYAGKADQAYVDAFGNLIISAAQG